MKRKSRSQQEAEFYLGRARHENSLQRKGKKYNPDKKIKSHNFFGYRYIVAPRNISIYSFSEGRDHYTDTVKFIEEIEKNFRRRKCIIDFRNTERVFAAAMVVVYAAFDNARINGDQNSIVFWSPIKSVNDSIKRNNLDLLIRNKNFVYRFESKEFLPIVASCSSLYREEIIDHIQKKVYGDQMSPETEHLYGDAVSETINNVNLHAYPNLEDDQKKKWWLMCHVYGKELYLAIYDSGVGIPKTVWEKPWLVASLKRIYPNHYDALIKMYPDLEKNSMIPFIFVPNVNDPILIHLAMQGDVSGTKKSKHGQGSKSIKKMVSETTQGKLWVFSNNGVYIFENETDEPVTFELSKRLPGTLVQWNIKLYENF